MKTNYKNDTPDLKAKHRLELVMQEAGESFEVDAANPDLWHSTITPGLTVDILRQEFEMKRPGMDSKWEDVIAWLRRYHNWTFIQAKTFLQKRPADPKRSEAAQPARADSFQITVDEDEAKPLDRWQEEALEIAGERIRKYFSWSWSNLAMYTDEIQIEPTHAPNVTICPRCEKRIDWRVKKTERMETDGWGNNVWRREHIGAIPVKAYSIKRRVMLSDSSLLEDAQTQLHDEDVGGDLYIMVGGEDDVICVECAWDEYDFQVVLKLVKTSAYWRDKAESEAQQKRDHEAWLEADAERVREQERQDREAENACWEAEQEKLQRENAPPA